MHEDELLRRPATDVARLLARTHLDHWVKVRGRLGDKNDPEALHDFRVGLRRLRSVLRAFRPQLEGRIPRKTWRRLTRLADATNESRNLQVERDWVRSQLDSLAPAERMGAQLLLARLAERQEAADHRVHRRVAKSFSPVRRRLRQALADGNNGHAEPARMLTTGAVVRRVVGREVGELARHLAAIYTVADREAAHLARISAKRLRYVLEPFEQAVPDGPAVVRQLTALQDILGQVQDANVMADELLDELGEPAGQHANGILALVRQVRSQGITAFEKLQSEWLDGKATPLLVRLAALGERQKPVLTGPWARGHAASADAQSVVPSRLVRQRA